jgi:hypothetical protein
VSYISFKEEGTLRWHAHTQGFRLYIRLYRTKTAEPMKFSISSLVVTIGSLGNLPLAIAQGVRYVE